MNHEQLKEHILLLPDSGFTGPERAQAEAHLAECRECAELKKAWDKAQKAFFSPTLSSAPDGFAEAVMRRLPAEETEPAEILSRWWTPAFGLAAACALLALSFFPTNGSVSTDDLLYNDTTATGYETVDEILNI